MIKPVSILSYVICISLISVNTARGNTAWQFTKTYESEKLSDNRFLLSNVADLNGNGFNEIILADFGRYGDHLGEWEAERTGSIYNFYVLEWNGEGLTKKFRKQWDIRESRKYKRPGEYFSAFEAEEIFLWPKGSRPVAETIPPYLGLWWDDGKYVLKEQQGPFQERPLVGSWAMKWISPSCYRGFSKHSTYPRECLIGIRRLSIDEKHRVVTLRSEEIIKDKKYKQTLRIRKIEPDWPIEWELLLNSNDYVGILPIEKASLSSRGKMSSIVLSALRSRAKVIIEPSKNAKDYKLRTTTGELFLGNITRDLPSPYLTVYDLNSVYLGSTKMEGEDEFWGYRLEKNPEKSPIKYLLLLRNVSLSTDFKSFVKEDITFAHHDSFLGVGYFAVDDIDGDETDEIIFVEQTGEAIRIGPESLKFRNVNDYIHILKWNGTKYQTIWTSPPYTKRGTKFLVEDIKGKGMMQLIVLTPEGKVQIWEKK